MLGVLSPSALLGASVDGSDNQKGMNLPPYTPEPVVYERYHVCPLMDEHEEAISRYLRLRVPGLVLTRGDGRPSLAIPLPLLVWTGAELDRLTHRRFSDPMYTAVVELLADVKHTIRETIA